MRLPISVAMSILWATPLFASVPHNSLESPVSVEAAYRGKFGGASQLIVILSASEERNHPELASGNRAFFGNDQDLWQLDASVPSELGSVETALSFFRGIVKGSETSGELSLTPTSARVECSPSGRDAPTAELARLSDLEQTEIEHRLASGSARLHPLPVLLEPLYLFTPSGDPARAPSSSSGGRKSPELVLVEGPVFNFHGDYRVEVGSLKKMSDIPLTADFRSWRADRPGEIHFASGGGLYIPLTIDLVAKSDRDHRGSPTMIRGATAEAELLEVPRLARTEIEALGFGKPEYARIHTPCDLSTEGGVAQVAPRVEGK